MNEFKLEAAIASFIKNKKANVHITATIGLNEKHGRIITSRLQKPNCWQ